VRNFMGKVSEGTATINLWWSCVGQSDFLHEGLRWNRQEHLGCDLSFLVSLRPQRRLFLSASAWLLRRFGLLLGVFFSIRFAILVLGLDRSQPPVNSPL